MGCHPRAHPRLSEPSEGRKIADGLAKNFGKCQKGVRDKELEHMLRRLLLSYYLHGHKGDLASFINSAEEILRTFYEVNRSKLSRKQREMYEKLLERNSQGLNANERKRLELILELFNALSHKGRYTNKEFAYMTALTLDLVKDKTKDIATIWLEFEQSKLYAFQKAWDNLALWNVSTALLAFYEKYKNLNASLDHAFIFEGKLRPEDYKALKDWWASHDLTPTQKEVYGFFQEQLEKGILEFGLASTIAGEFGSVALTQALRKTIVSSLLALTEFVITVSPHGRSAKAISQVLKGLAKIIDKSFLVGIGMEVSIEWQLDGWLQTTILEPTREKLIRFLYGREYVYGIEKNDFLYLYDYLNRKHVLNQSHFDAKAMEIFGKLPVEAQLSLLLHLERKKAYLERIKASQQKTFDNRELRRRYLEKLTEFTNAIKGSMLNKLLQSPSAFNKLLEELKHDINMANTIGHISNLLSVMKEEISPVVPYIREIPIDIYASQNGQVFREQPYRISTLDDIDIATENMRHIFKRQLFTKSYENITPIGEFPNDQRCSPIRTHGFEHLPPYFFSRFSSGGNYTLMHHENRTDNSYYMRRKLTVNMTPMSAMVGVHVVAVGPPEYENFCCSGGYYTNISSYLYFETEEVYESFEDGNVSKEEALKLLSAVLFANSAYLHSNNVVLKLIDGSCIFIPPVGFRCSSQFSYIKTERVISSNVSATLREMGVFLDDNCYQVFGIPKEAEEGKHATSVFAQHENYLRIINKSLNVQYNASVSSEGITVHIQRHEVDKDFLRLYKPEGIVDKVIKNRDDNFNKSFFLPFNRTLHQTIAQVLGTNNYSQLLR